MMNPLESLTELLRNATLVGEKSFRRDTSIDVEIAKLRQKNMQSNGISMPQDLQLQALEKFTRTGKLENLKEARLVSFGLAIKRPSTNQNLFEDNRRFREFFDKNDGIEQYITSPNTFKRCYQGLVCSYFEFDPEDSHSSPIAKSNWNFLKVYLSQKKENIKDVRRNSDWVNLIVENSQLFDDNPCVSYARELLKGEKERVKHLVDQLGIKNTSWFIRELVMAQFNHAANLNYETFTGYIPTLIKYLEKNLVLRDRGLTIVLNKYAKTAQPKIHQILKKSAIEWWGNPWLPSNKLRWGGVDQDAREMVSEWLKREFIDEFFTKLAEDRVGDKRRATFWKRYVKSMDNIHFALGEHALNSQDPDFVALRKKMEGLFVKLKSNDSNNNAFIMTLGDLVVVEFGGIGNALYGYSANKKLPFDLTKELSVTVNGLNSLKNEKREFKLLHTDGGTGYSKWEDKFETELNVKYGIKSNDNQNYQVHYNVKNGVNQFDKSIESQRGENNYYSDKIFRKEYEDNGVFNKNKLMEMASFHNFKIDDLSNQNGYIWVRCGTTNPSVCLTLKKWGFTYKKDKGWFIHPPPGYH